MKGELERLLEAAVEETQLSLGLEEAYDRGKKPTWAVLMGRLYAPHRPGLHKDRLRERLTLGEALEFLRGLRLGFALGSGRTRPGPKALKFMAEAEHDQETKGKD